MKNSQWSLLIITFVCVFTIAFVFVFRNLGADVIHYTDQLPTEQAIGTEGKINLNTATVSQLMLLPDIGPKIAQRIVDYRDKNGSYSCIEDLMFVKGIGEKRFQELRDYITVGG